MRFFDLLLSAPLAAFLSTGEWEAVRLSLFVAGAAAIGSLPAGVALGWLLARKRFPGKTLVETAVNLPLVLPPVVTGYLLLVVFGKNGWLGGWLDQWFGLRFIFDWKGAVLAAAVVSFPLLVRAVRISMAGVDRRLEEAARTLGAGPIDAFFSVTLPLASRGVIAGFALAYARALGEFGATVVIAGNIAGQTRTIPLFIYSALESPGGVASARALVLASIAIAAIALFLSERLERRQQTAAA
jgi:molybdate transport system permease protein